jgi:hypothetical protein
VDIRAGHYERHLERKAGAITLRVPSTREKQLRERLDRTTIPAKAKAFRPYVAEQDLLPLLSLRTWVARRSFGVFRQRPDRSDGSVGDHAIQEDALSAIADTFEQCCAGA